MNRADLQRLSQLRLDEATALANTGFPAGAYYLAGYSIECALKACIARGVQQFDFPDKAKVQQSYTHDLVQLLKIAGLEVDLEREMQADSNLASNWAKVKDWSEDKRYDHATTQRNAQEILDAISDSTSGVFQWLTQRW